MISRLLFVFPLLVWSLSALAEDLPGDRKAGLEYSRANCSACHVVEPGQSRMGAKAAASFEAIANTPGMTAMALSVWFRTSHRDMPNLQLSDGEIQNLIAYIVSLRNKK